MRILRIALLGLTLCAAGWPQNPKLGVDWDAISQKLDALRVAVQARDVETAKEAAGDLWRFTTDELRKQAPTPADYLQHAEERTASNSTSWTKSLPYMAMLAFQAGEMEKAEQYARLTLQSPSSAYDSIHSGNIVLGLVALQHGDVAGAGAYLLAATKTKGSASLDRWGPNLALAKALLDKGQDAVVLEYFQASKNFVTKNPKLDDWIAILKGGRAPDLKHEFLWFQ